MRILFAFRKMRIHCGILLAGTSVFLKISLPFFASKPLVPILNDSRRNTASSMRITSFCALDSVSCLRLVGLVMNRLVAHRSAQFSRIPRHASLERVKAHITSSPPRYAYGLNASASELFGSLAEMFRIEFSTHPYN